MVCSRKKADTLGYELIQAGKRDSVAANFPRGRRLEFPTGKSHWDNKVTKKPTKKANASLEKTNRITNANLYGNSTIFDLFLFFYGSDGLSLAGLLHNSLCWIEMTCNSYTMLWVLGLPRNHAYGTRCSRPRDLHIYIYIYC